MTALERDVPGGPEAPIRYSDLFKEDKDFNQSAFVERARNQCLRAPREYVGQIETAMREADADGDGAVSLAEAAEAIRAVDPTLPDAQLDALVSVGAPGLSELSTVDVRLFCRRLLFSYPSRFGPPPKSKRRV